MRIKSDYLHTEPSVRGRSSVYHLGELFSYSYLYMNDIPVFKDVRTVILYDADDVALLTSAYKMSAITNSF